MHTDCSPQSHIVFDDRSFTARRTCIARQMKWLDVHPATLTYCIFCFCFVLFVWFTGTGFILFVSFLILCLLAAVSAPLEPCLSSSVTACVLLFCEILLSKIYIYIYMMNCRISKTQTNKMVFSIENLVLSIVLRQEKGYDNWWIITLLHWR